MNVGGWGGVWTLLQLRYMPMDVWLKKQSSTWAPSRLVYKACAGKHPCYCSDPKEGPAEEGHGFHKALSSINVSQSTFSTWLNIIPAMLWSRPVLSDDKFSTVIDDALCASFNSTHAAYSDNGDRFTT